MSKSFKGLGAVLTICASFAGTASAEPVRIGIANFGEDPALNQAIEGFKRAFRDAGMTEGDKVVFSASHTNFDSSLVPQMITKLASEKPALIYTQTTPVTQIARQTLAGTDIPIVFGVVTDPVAAGLVPSWDKGAPNLTGASDQMDMDVVMEFVRKFSPTGKSFGLPYNPGEANDVALLEVTKKAGENAGLTVVSVGVDAVNDIPQRITSLASQADVIYLPTSNLLQPAASAVASAARQTKTPVVNSNDLPVIEGVLPASIAVSYEQVGYNAGKIAIEIVNGTDPETIAPVKAGPADHKPLISRRGLAAFGLELPPTLADCGCIVD